MYFTPRVLYVLSFSVKFAASQAIDLRDSGRTDYGVEDALGELEQIYVPSSHCVDQALGGILGLCRNNGVEALDLVTKKYSALKLTICELHSIGLSIPDTCQHLLTARASDNCILELEKIPQYWTTYTGNYREIGKICYEESLPHEKNQVVNLYTNITTVIHRLQKNLFKSLNVSDTVQLEISQKIESLHQKMSQFADFLTKSQTELHDTHDKSAKMAQDMLDSSLSVVKFYTSTAETNINELAVNLNFLNQQFNDMRDALIDTQLGDQLSALKQKVSQEATEAFESFSELTDAIKQDSNEASTHLQEQKRRLNEEMESNMLLASQLSHLLTDSQGNAIKQADAFNLNIDKAEHILGHIFSAMDSKVNELSSNIDMYIDELDIKVHQTLNNMKKVNREIKYLSRFFTRTRRFFAKITSSILQLVHIVTEFTLYNPINHFLQAIMTSKLIYAHICTFITVFWVYHWLKNSLHISAFFTGTPALIGITAIVSVVVYKQLIPSTQQEMTSIAEIFRSRNIS